MQFRWETRESDGLSALVAEPGHYDGVPPIRTLLVGTSPEQVDANLVALAAALAFEAYVADEVALPEPVLPLVADAISDFFLPLRVKSPTVEYKPRRATEGQGSIDVLWGAHAPYVADQSYSPKLGAFRVMMTENYESPRGYAYKDTLVLPSNAKLLSPRSISDSRRLFPEIAALLLVVGELGIRNIRLRTETFTAEDEHLSRARTLIRSVNRELSWG